MSRRSRSRSRRDVSAAPGGSFFWSRSSHPPDPGRVLPREADPPRTFGTLVGSSCGTQHPLGLSEPWASVHRQWSQECPPHMPEAPYGRRGP
jgi:hypothetical protein